MKTVLSVKHNSPSAKTFAAQNKNTPTPMHINHKKLRYYAAVAGALLALTSSSLAQNVLLDFSTNSIFVQTNFVTTWHWWGGAATVQEASTNDAGNDPTSGSFKITANWPTGSGSDYQYSVGLPLSGLAAYDTGVTLNPLNYTNMEFDLMWDTNSTMNITNHMTGGDPNGFGFGFVATQYGQSWVPNGNQPVLQNDGQWHHFAIPINPAWPVIPGVIFKKWMPYNAANEGTVSIFYVDNIKFNFNTNATIPRPQMVLQKATKGLNIHAAQSGSQYQRNGVRSIPADAHQWYGNTDPVTYSVTIGEFPDGAAYGGFQGHIFLTADGGTTEPDWNSSHVIFVQFQATGSGQGICNFRFKTNSPNSNGQGTGGFFGTGAIMSKTWPTITGTWSVTFTNNSFITVVGPDGTGTNFDMGPDAAVWFQAASAMGTYFGCQPNNPPNIGQKMVYSRLKMTDGSTTVFDDTFPVEDPFFEVDPALWSVQTDATAANALKVVDQAAYWVDWNKPDGFLTALNISSNIVSGWVDPGLTLLDFGTRRGIYATVTNNLVDYQNAAYFKLVTTNSLH
jgi:hypothetical protein